MDGQDGGADLLGGPLARRMALARTVAAPAGVPVQAGAWPNPSPPPAPPRRRRRGRSLGIVGLVIALSLTVSSRVGSGGVASGPHAFLQLESDGVTPVRWSACQPIPYVVRTEHAPSGADDLITDAIDRVSEVTGLQFVDEGATTEYYEDSRALRQPSRYGDGWAPVLIAFETPFEQPRFATDVVGLGGGRAVATGGGRRSYVTGAVQLDSAWFADQMTSRVGRREARAVLLHELGHLVGLDHVHDSSQLMNAQNRGVRDFQGGDLEGLAELGRGPC